MPYLVIAYYNGDDEDNTVVECETWKGVKKSFQYAPYGVRWIVENVENLQNESVVHIDENKVLSNLSGRHYVIVNLTQTVGRRLTIDKLPDDYVGIE